MTDNELEHDHRQLEAFYLKILPKPPHSTANSIDSRWGMGVDKPQAEPLHTDFSLGREPESEE